MASSPTLVAASITLAAATAAARPPVALEDPLIDEPPAANTTRTAVPLPSEKETWTLRKEMGIGIRWGSFLVNNVDATDTVKQLHIDGGLRFRDHRLFAYGQYAIQSMQIPLDELAERSGTPVAIGNGRGLLHRFGAHARYGFARAGKEDGGIDIYADVGVGVQHIRWDAGGAWTRPDLSLALGLTGFGIGDTRHGGLSLAVVLMLAPRSDVEGAGRACGGPCDYATEPTGFDRSFMFDVTLNFGK